MITAERKQILRGFAQPSTPEERDFLMAYVDACGLTRTVTPKPARDLNDYEGAILARQEQSGIYD